jgi:hypothetical protein
MDKNFIPPIPHPLTQAVLEALEEGAPDTKVAAALNLNYKTYQRLRSIQMSRVPSERDVRQARALDRVRDLARSLGYPPKKGPSHA